MILTIDLGPSKDDIEINPGDSLEGCLRSFASNTALPLMCKKHIQIFR